MGRWIVALALVWTTACGDDDGGNADAAMADSGLADGAAMDADSADGGSDAPLMDGAIVMDAAMGDGGEMADAGDDAAVADAGDDAGPMDAGDDAGPMDAGPRDAGMACHDYDFGREAVAIERVSSLPPLTGGTIPDGTYDAIGSSTTLARDGTYRATWVFEGGDTIHSLDAINLGGTPPPVVPRTLSYTTTGNRLLRTRTCSESGTFDNEYEVREEGGVTILEVGGSTVRFRFQRRD